MFVPAYSIDRVRPAAYNPRAISPDAIDNLRSSLKRLGFAKPIIVLQDGTLVAGHQRTKAAKLEGMTTAPAFVIRGELDPNDEVRFNQLHNGTDLDDYDGRVTIDPPVGKVGTFEDVAPERVHGDMTSSGLEIRKMIGGLILRYGPWGGVVATTDGIVVSSPHYALAAVQLRKPVRVFWIAPEGATEAKDWFTRQYGEFSYDHLPRTTYIQTLAQLPRLRNGGLTPRDNRSVTYTEVVLPRLNKTDRLLDFGCGQGDYVRRLQQSGQRAFGIEFFRRHGKALDYRATHALIDSALGEWTKRGGFDVVVVDSVMNSVDSPQAERDVMVCANTFCRPGGRIVLSGRFHSREEIEGYPRFGGYDGQPDVTITGGTWRTTGLKTRAFEAGEIEASLRREFDLPWPDGKRVGRSEAAVTAWKRAIEVDKQYQS